MAEACERDRHPTTFTVLFNRTPAVQNSSITDNTSHYLHWSLVLYPK